jgi:hypothetical protein
MPQPPDLAIPRPWPDGYADAYVHADIKAAGRAKTIAIWAAVFAVIIGALFLGGGIGFWLAGR